MAKDAQKDLMNVVLVNDKLIRGTPPKCGTKCRLVYWVTKEMFSFPICARV